MNVTTIDSPSRILPLLCKQTGKWGMYLSVSHNEGFRTSFDEYDEFLVGVADAASWLSAPQVTALASQGYAYCLFDSEEDMLFAYLRTVGEDGPTRFNPYEGPVTIYALTCDPQGDLLTENT